MVPSPDCKINDYILDVSQDVNIQNLGRKRNTKIFIEDELDSNYQIFSIDSIPQVIPKTFAVSMGTATFDCYFNDQQSDYLLVTLRAYRGAQNDKDIWAFQRWTYFKYVNASILSINNPMYRQHPKLHTGYYLGYKDENYLSYLSQLILAISKIINVKPEKIIILGSSASGTTAIHCSYLIPNSVSVSINPQLLPNIGKELNDDLKKINVNLDDFDIVRRDSAYCLNNSNSKHLIITNIAHSDDLRPIINYATDNNIETNYGINVSNDNRVFLWFYEAWGIGGLTAHHSFENRTMMMFIEYILKKWICGKRKKTIDRQLLTIASEAWFDLYDIRTQDEINKYRYLIDNKYETNCIEKNNFIMDNSLMNKFRYDCYSKGYGVQTNPDKALICIRKALELDGSYELDLISALWQKKNSVTDLELFNIVSKLSLKSDKVAMGWLGRAYRDGRGVERNLELAAIWMKKAADKNLAWAIWEYFDILWSFNNPDKDVLAIDFGLPYAELGIRDMEARIGRAYRDGRGVERNLELAAIWMKKAADKNLAWACKELEKLLNSDENSPF